WIRRMLQAHEGAAQASGARIVHCCGFDSIPSDLGTWALQREVEALHGRPCEAITLYVDRAKGGVSGGTIASMLNIVEEATRDPSVRKIAGHPYALNPEGERSGPDGSDQMGLGRAPDGRPTAPFVMAAINTRVVRRSNALLGYAYGRDFRYAEVMRFPATPKGQALALGMTAGLGALMLGLGVGPTRRLLAERVLPKPGEGPSADEREAGYFRMSLEGHGHDATGKPFEARYRVEGDLDPGYGQTAVMLGEAALCLALDASPAGPAGLRGGVLTPASALGAALLERLRAAGMRFELSG
ncbi:MAG: saccharopine dehydrogenase, partial [Myxococcales bacterium]|nr:saccharopine dehydrogenase [Myxococcales bacterium]